MGELCTLQLRVLGDRFPYNVCMVICVFLKFHMHLVVHMFLVGELCTCSLYGNYFYMLQTKASPC